MCFSVLKSEIQELSAAKEHQEIVIEELKSNIIRYGVYIRCFEWCIVTYDQIIPVNL